VSPKSSRKTFLNILLYSDTDDPTIPCSFENNVIPKEIIQTIQTRIVKIKIVLWVAGLLLKNPPGNVVIPIVAIIINNKKRITLRIVVNLKLETRPVELKFVGKLIRLSK
jgi:hypothetical protein